MSDPSSNCTPPTCSATLNVTSLLALVDGPTLCGSPAGPTTRPCGPAAAPVSPSAPPAANEAPPTSGISGPRGSLSSLSADLQSSLESRLRALTASVGSTLFALTWKERVTPSGYRICALRASVPRTSDSVCISWPSPTVNDSKGSAYSYANGDHSRPCLKLTGSAQLAHWPTALKSNCEHSAHEAHMDGRRSNLMDTALLSSWATPAAHEAGGTPEQFLARKEKANASGSSLGVSLTSLSLQAQLVASGRPPNGCSAETEKPGQLNPAHSRWLMGYPPEWDACAVTVTPLSRRSRRSSSKR